MMLASTRQCVMDTSTIWLPHSAPVVNMRCMSCLRRPASTIRRPACTPAQTTAITVGCPSRTDGLRITNPLRLAYSCRRSVRKLRVPQAHAAAVAQFAKISEAVTMVAGALQWSVMQLPMSLLQVPPAVLMLSYAIWALGPSMRALRRLVFRRDDLMWEESRSRYMMASYIRPVLLWASVIVLCRAFEPIVLDSVASQAIKQRFTSFVRSLTTVLTFAFCTASLTQQIQKLMEDRQVAAGIQGRNMGVQFVGKTVYTLVWVAAVTLFMELLGFSTQKWITAGGFGTVLLTLAGRELLTNFLSSIMIHATRPFMVNEWIVTKIDGQEVSGTVEHVGWWEPSVIRGDDREAVHIPNHKFSVSVVRNLSQKTHWRIKAYFGISHLDSTKIGDIVATMRKVVAKHPQLEQRQLHRRVFFESVNPDTQALNILVSCFVKTPHFEEYLRVKELVLLDLMKVISYHGARLATPIRSVQRIVEDAHDHPQRHPQGNERGRPYLLLESSRTIEEHPETVQMHDSREGSGAERMRGVGGDGAGDRSEDGRGGSKTGPITVNLSGGGGSKGGVREGGKGATHVGEESRKGALEGLDSMGLNDSDITLLGAAFEKTATKNPTRSYADGGQKAGNGGGKVNSETASSSGLCLTTGECLQAGEMGEDGGESGRGMGGGGGQFQGGADNLVLGVALDGPRRTLTLDEEEMPVERDMALSSKGDRGVGLNERDR